MKKIISLLLVLGLLATLFAGCAPKSEGNTSSSTTTSSSTSTSSGDASDKTFRIGLIQLTEHPSLDTICETIVAALPEEVKDSKVEFDVQNAQGDSTNINSIIQKFVGAKVDMIVTIATTPAQAALSATSTIPIVFAAVSNPMEAKLMTDMAKPDKNITGTSDRLPIDQIFSMMKDTVPQMKTVGLLYNAGEPNSLAAIEEAKAYCKDNNINFVEATATNAGEVQQAATSLVGKCDVVFTPTDNTVATAMVNVSKIMMDAKLPIFTGADSMVMDGGFATVGIDYTVLGKVTAEMAGKILSGTPISEIPSVEMTDFAKVINKKTAAALGIDISAYEADPLVRIVE